MAKSSVVELKRSILDTTRKLLVAEGYQNLSMRKIANAIGFSATSLYLYFDSKDHLVHALIDEGMEQLYQVLHAAREKTSKACARLEALCESYIAFGMENPEYYEIMFQLHPQRMARYPVEKFRRAKRNLDFFTVTLQEGVEQGDFAVRDFTLATNYIWAALHGTVSLMHAQRLDSHIEWEKLKEKVVLQVIRSVQKH